MTSRRVAFITGASSGIGYATALAFARDNTDIAGTARRTQRLDQLVTAFERLPGEHGTFLPITADVCDAKAMQSAVELTIEHFGRLDVLIANAGVGHRGSIIEASWEDIEVLLRTNIDGVLHSIRAVVPVMRSGGKIIIISSVVYNMTLPYAAYYAATKAFVSSIAHSLRLELQVHGISVTDMLIGRTETEFNESRLGASGRSASGIPIMSVEKVATAIVKASHQNRRSIALRWFDRVLLLGNFVIPEIIGKRALKQYK